jgi:hypothetical protein
LNNHKSAKLKAFNELETIGFGLLMFSIRGMCLADITSLTSHNLDYNFASRISHEQKGAGSEISLLGNSHIYRHGGHKREFPMKILISLPPVGHLIGVLRFLVAASHPEYSYLTPEDAANPNYNAWLRKIDEVLGSSWCESDVFMKQNPDYVYSAFGHSIQSIIDDNRTFVR